MDYLWIDINIYINAYYIIIFHIQDTSVHYFILHDRLAGKDNFFT